MELLGTDSIVEFVGLVGIWRMNQTSEWLNGPCKAKYSVAYMYRTACGITHWVLSENKWTVLIFNYSVFIVS